MHLFSPSKDAQQSQARANFHHFDVNMVLVTRKLFDYLQRGDMDLIQAAIRLIGPGNIHSVRFNNESLSPVHVAAMNGGIEVIRYLVEELGCEFRLVDAWGRTALVCALLYSQARAVKYLEWLHATSDQEKRLTAHDGNGEPWEYQLSTETDPLPASFDLTTSSASIVTDDSVHAVYSMPDKSSPLLLQIDITDSITNLW
jgi:hypothetical protein